MANPNWTIMIYMAADDPVATKAASEFLAELNRLGIALDLSENKDKINIWLQIYKDWDNELAPPYNYRTRRYRVKTNFLQEPIGPDMQELYSEHAMGSAEVLTEFIEWCKKDEAKKYLLLLWGHGTGSGLFDLEIEEDHDKLLQKAPDFALYDLYNGEKVSLKELLKPDSAYFNKDTHEANLELRYTDENNQPVRDIITATQESFEIFEKPKYKLKTNKPATLEKLQSYITSRSDLDGLVGRELNKSLEVCFGNVDDKLNLLVVLGCCMQMVEFGYEIRNHCHLYVASEELIYFEGYNYFDTFKLLIDKPDLSELELGMKLIELTPQKEFYTKEKQSYLAISCVDLQKNDEIFDRMNDIASTIMDNYDQLHNLIKDSREKCYHFGENAYRSSYIDLIWFLLKLKEQLEENNLFEELRSKIEELINFIKYEPDKTDRYIIEKFIGERKEPKLEQKTTLGGHGVGIYFPSSMEDHINDQERGKFFDINEPDYVNQFSKNNTWNRVIFKYMEKIPGSKIEDLPQPIPTPTPILPGPRMENLVSENKRLRKLIDQYL